MVENIGFGVKVMWVWCCFDFVKYLILEFRFLVCKAGIIIFVSKNEWKLSVEFLLEEMFINSWIGILGERECCVFYLVI